MTPEKALNILAGMCSKKEYCSKSIREKLLRWEFPEQEIHKILDFLYKYQFVDDRRYARIYAEDKFRFNHWGKQKINMMLRQKGIETAMIEEALEQLNSPAYRESCLELMKQKMKSLSEPDPYKLKAKLTRFALGRGFDYDTVGSCFQELRDYTDD